MAGKTLRRKFIATNNRTEVEITDKAVAKALESASKPTVSQGKYNC